MGREVTVKRETAASGIASESVTTSPKKLNEITVSLTLQKRSKRLILLVHLSAK